MASLVVAIPALVFYVWFSSLAISTRHGFSRTKGVVAVMLTVVVGLAVVGSLAVAATVSTT